MSDEDDEDDIGSDDGSAHEDYAELASPFSCRLTRKLIVAEHRPS